MNSLKNPSFSTVAPSTPERVSARRHAVAWFSSASRVNPASPSSDRWMVNARAHSPELVQMLEVALSRRNVLLARRQGQHIAAAALRVDGLAGQPAGHLAHQLVAGGEQADIGAAEVQRIAERLALARPRCRRPSRLAARSGRATPPRRPPRPAARPCHGTPRPGRAGPGDGRTRSASGRRRRRSARRCGPRGPRSPPDRPGIPPTRGR